MRKRKLRRERKRKVASFPSEPQGMSPLQACSVNYPQSPTVARAHCYELRSVGTSQYSINRSALGSPEESISLSFEIPVPHCLYVYPRCLYVYPSHHSRSDLSRRMRRRKCGGCWRESGNARMPITSEATQLYGDVLITQLRCQAVSGALLSLSLSLSRLQLMEISFSLSPSTVCLLVGALCEWDIVHALW